MIQINSYEEYSTLVKTYRKQHAPVQNNLFLLPQELKQIISEGRMAYCTSDQALLLFVDEGRFYHLYYFLPDSGSLLFERTDKPVLVEVIYNVNRDGEAIDAIREKCLQAGARFKKRSHQLEMREEQQLAAMKKDYDAVCGRLRAAELSISFAQKADLPRIQKLWDAYLDFFDFKYMPQQTLEAMIAHQEILTVKNAAGELLASKCIQTSGSRSLGYHLVVDDSARGNGLGKVLMYEWFRIAQRNSAKICNAWVAEENRVSLNCHLKAGAYTGKASEQYVFEI